MNFTKRKMYLKIYIFLVLTAAMLTSNIVCANGNKYNSNKIDKNIYIDEARMHNQNDQREIYRPEHIALNVADPVSVAKWYVDNLSMKIFRQSGAPSFGTFLGDTGNHIMFELYHNTDYPLFDAANISHMSIHFAFMVNDIGKIKEKLLTAGAKLVEDVTTTPSGDKVLMLRDPWNLPIQFVQRAITMLPFTELRPEHVALNVEDPVAKAKWFEKNMGYKIVRQGGAPTFTTFIADQNENMMMELYHNADYPLLDINNISYMSLHFASLVSDIHFVKDNLIKAGAKLAEDIKTTQSGDEVLMLRDPWGQPLQFVTRKEKMIE